VGNFPSDNCNPYQFFYDHFNIFTNTFCGDWAGSPNIWNYAGWAGQDKSCAAITGYSTCDDYVRNVGSAFKDAYWEVCLSSSGNLSVGWDGRRKLVWQKQRTDDCRFSTSSTTTLPSTSDLAPSPFTCLRLFVLVMPRRVDLCVLVSDRYFGLSAPLCPPA
jgi:hypothetical protein